MKLILASSSPRRVQLLKENGIRFTIVKHGADEEAVIKRLKSHDPVKVANMVAYAKAFSVASKIKKGLVLGSDTIVVINNKIIGKPTSIKDAEKILGTLSKGTHRVITSIVFMDAATYKTVITHDISYVTFKKLSKDWIKKYVRTNNVMDKAGAYAVQENSDPFIKEVKGSYSNVVGLPIEKVKSVLKHWEKL
ncbi:MAG: Maf family protein [bacterium]